MKELTDDQILDHLKQNTIGRNKQLSVLVKLLNSGKDNMVLAIDGAWGSGKTVFVKQLLMLADESVEDYGRNTLDVEAIKKLRETHHTVYFNAWEYDYLDDALGAILLKLIADKDVGLNKASITRAFSMINPSATLKNLSHDFIDTNASTKQDKLLENVKSILDRHSAVNRLLDDLKAKVSKERVVFVIDELDRCKPSFAMDLLEIIKHYFDRDDITFLISTNMRELSHTVKKYYGHNFDGYAYLNKFVEYTMSLKKANVSDYTKKMLNWNLDYGGDETAESVIKHYKFEMREINAYHSSLQLIMNFLSRSNSWRQNQYSMQLIFVPLALGLKIRNYEDYEKFIHGRGGDLLRDFLDKTESRLDLADVAETTTRTDESQQKEVAIEYLVKQYEQLVAQTGGRGAREDLNAFDDAISLIGAYTTIIDEDEQ